MYIYHNEREDKVIIYENKSKEKIITILSNNKYNELIDDNKLKEYLSECGKIM